MKKYVFLIIFLITLCLVLSSCQEEPEPTFPSPTFQMENITFTSAQVQLLEAKNAVGAAYSLKKNMELADYNGVSYAFEPSISLSDREACILATDALISRIGSDKRLHIVVYTAETYDKTFIQDGTVYTYLQNWKSAEYIAAVIQGLFGEYCSYGGAYGYANYLANQAFEQSLNLCDSDWVFDGERDLLDLNIFSFHLRFFTGKDVKTAKKIANTFVSDYISKNGEAAFLTLLTQSGQKETAGAFNKALSDFYAQWDIAYTPTDILFRLGGYGYEYIAMCQYATMYMEKDWTDCNTGLIPMYYEGFLRKNYGEIRTYLTTITKEMGQYQALFQPDTCDNGLSIYYTRHYKNGRTGDYIHTSHSIALPYINSLTIHYIEALVGSQLIQDPWAYSGTLALFSYYYDYYGNTEQTYTANLTEEHPTLAVYRQYRAYIGRDVDIFTDYTDLSHFYAYKNGIKDPNNGGADSFIAYLVGRFGEKEVIDILCRTHDLGEYSYAELVADWQVFLSETFSDYERS